jgi:4-carboxymuconolactone decarboxylase
MKSSIFPLLIVVSLLTPVLAIGSEENKMEKLHALSQRQRSIIPIGAFTADGDINRLKPALNQGLDGGLTVNEIKEVLVHLYAYTGFPRSLNALSAFMEVMEGQRDRGYSGQRGQSRSTRSGQG